MRPSKEIIENMAKAMLEGDGWKWEGPGDYVINNKTKNLYRAWARKAYAVAAPTIAYEERTRILKWISNQ